jgi:hypothetical protein
LTPALPRPRQGLATMGYSRFKEVTCTAALDDELLVSVHALGMENWPVLRSQSLT